jgi:hypothetical protein
MSVLATQPEIISIVDVILKAPLTKGDKVMLLLCNTQIPALKIYELVDRG